MKKIQDILSNKNIPLKDKLQITTFIHNGIYNFNETLENNLKFIADTRQALPTTRIYTLGYFGNVWIRLQQYKKKDEINVGHKHKHDHMSLLVKGGLKVFVEDKEPFEVWASSDPYKPTFFEVPAEHYHTLVPLEDDTIAYCVFALKDYEGEYTEEPDKSDWTQYGKVDET